MNIRVAIILGTRPEIIKMSPIIRECEKRHIDYFILHTGQHYTYNMDRIFFEQLKLPEARYNLDVGSSTHGKQTGKMFIEIEKILIREKPNIVLVEGDTNTVLAGAVTASKLYIKVGHIEAGLRSYDRQMPEEINRILTDHCSDYLFAPTEKSMNILLKECIDKEKIFVTGNTIVDAIYHNIKLFKNCHLDQLSNRLKIELRRKEYILMTAHRQENVDNMERFKCILHGVELVSKEFNMPVIYPIHPRSMKMLKKFNLDINNNIKFIDPLDYINFLCLEKNAILIMTDSGGVQEEACILRVPCVTFRDNTERPETVEVNANIISGIEPKNILKCSKKMISTENSWTNPFGDGTSAEKIMNILNYNK